MSTVTTTQHPVREAAVELQEALTKLYAARVTTITAAQRLVAVIDEHTDLPLHNGIAYEADGIRNDIEHDEVTVDRSIEYTDNLIAAIDLAIARSDS